jgi:hypothetical protein
MIHQLGNPDQHAGHTTAADAGSERAVAEA